MNEMYICTLSTDPQMSKMYGTHSTNIWYIYNYYKITLSVLPKINLTTNTTITDIDMNVFDMNFYLIGTL